MGSFFTLLNLIHFELRSWAKVIKLFMTVSYNHNKINFSNIMQNMGCVPTYHATSVSFTGKMHKKNFGLRDHSYH